MMLSKNARELLRLAKRADNQKIEYQKLKLTLGWDFDKARSAGDQLVSAGLAKEKCFSPRPGSDVLWGIVLTEEGRNSRKYFWAGVAEFFVKSVAVPVLVAFVTAVLTTLAIG